MMPSYDQLGRRGIRSSGMSRIAATCARSAAFVKSRPPSRFVVFEKSREPIALHWPVIELAPVPGRPMLPVKSARLMAAWAVLTPWWLWFTPIVHQNETRSDRSIRPAASMIVWASSPVSLRHELRVEAAHELRELVEAAGMAVDEAAVDRAALDQQVCDPVRAARGRTWGGSAGAAWPPSPSRSGAGR